MVNGMLMRMVNGLLRDHVAVKEALQESRAKANCINGDEG